MSHEVAARVLVTATVIPRLSEAGEFLSKLPCMAVGRLRRSTSKCMHVAVCRSRIPPIGFRHRLPEHIRDMVAGGPRAREKQEPQAESMAFF